MARAAHLLGLQVYACSFETSQQIFPGTGFSMAGHRKAFHMLGVQDVAEFDSG
jgi:hypothetical protein